MRRKRGDWFLGDQHSYCDQIILPGYLFPLKSPGEAVSKSRFAKRDIERIWPGWSAAILAHTSTTRVFTSKKPGHGSGTNWRQRLWLVAMSQYSRRCGFCVCVVLCRPLYFVISSFLIWRLEGLHRRVRELEEHFSCCVYLCGICPAICHTFLRDTRPSQLVVACVPLAAQPSFGHSLQSMELRFARNQTLNQDKLKRLIPISDRLRQKEGLGNAEMGCPHPGNPTNCPSVCI